MSVQWQSFLSLSTMEPATPPSALPPNTSTPPPFVLSKVSPPTIPRSILSEDVHYHVGQLYALFSEMQGENATLKLEVQKLRDEISQLRTLLPSSTTDLAETSNKISSDTVQKK
ncbi:hypothetical protein O6H91_10G033300 [Diphasiastrum complanatum]|uniref:Uncharacterized protein n=2 Tax=Diphasiastrum complanatum TaxID=34168 RepID=A0ACC2CFV1_DIPCM|nr:hypothetical protein O6H91_10G032100 [Diphasiastrum complanatum]KAJ7540849.1 hypothetical protein O6H91_10G033300 [Diphasiastrum complanatum]